MVGAGAIGTFLGVHLARTGCELSALARGATAVALRAHGFRFQQDGAALHAPVRVAESASALGEQDLVVVAVKAPALAAVAESIGALLAAHTTVLPAMNGVPWWFFHGLGGPHEGAAVRAVDVEGRIAAAIPVRHVLGCVVHATCAVVEPGLVRHGFGRGLIVGEPGGGVSERVSALADRLSAKSPAAYALIPAVCLVIGGPLYALAITRESLPLLLGLISVTTFLTFGYLGVTYAALQNLMHPRMRATCSAVLNVIYGLVSGIGPILLGAAKPCHIVTPTATVRRLLNLTALASVDAGAGR